MEWQPIETAPRGELILYAPAVFKARRGMTNPPRIYIGHANGTPFRPPTHWMRLPEPPGEFGA